MTLLITVNQKFAKLIVGEEEELCLLMSKVITSIVIVWDKHSSLLGPRLAMKRNVLWDWYQISPIVNNLEPIR